MSKKDKDINRKQLRRNSIKGSMSLNGAAAATNREKNIARELRDSSWWRSKIASGKCYYCGEIFKPSELTMDHKIPISRGGRSEKINIVPACKVCNNKKKYMLPIEWDEYMNKLKSS
jgi:5-methylcytosine-specific restriction endonuclease McrA